jgi:hypothetical protein
VRPLCLVDAAAAIRDAFHYDPGHSDLDDEQPIHISVTLGDWRKLNMALREAGPVGVNERLLAALRGMVGLVQLVQKRYPDFPVDNHRVLEALSAISEAEQ